LTPDLDFLFHGLEEKSRLQLFPNSLMWKAEDGGAKQTGRLVA